MSTNVSLSTTNTPLWEIDMRRARLDRILLPLRKAEINETNMILIRYRKHKLNLYCTMKDGVKTVTQVS